MQHHQRFHSLDGLRGIAAIAVMLFHCGGDVAPGGYLAVDFFLCLSGFVIALSYGERLRAGMGLAHFMHLRIARIWPMVVVGGALAMLFHSASANMLFLVPNWRSSLLFPANPPFWSLLAEMGAYALFGLALLRMATALLVVIMIASALALGLALVDAPGLDFGSGWSTISGGALRTLYSFTAGVVLHRWWSARRLERRVHPYALALLALLVALLMFDPAERRWWDFFCATLALPGVIWLGTLAEMPGRALWQRLGDLSYPLYCIHVPLLFWLGDTEQQRLLVAATLIPVALAMDALYDRPARAWLKRQVQSRAKRASTLPAIA